MAMGAKNVPTRSLTHRTEARSTRLQTSSARSDPKLYHPFLCTSCCCIAWEDLFDQSKAHSVWFPIYDQPAEELKHRVCIICQYIGEVLKMSYKHKITNEPRYQVEVKEYVGFEDETFAILHVKVRGGYEQQNKDAPTLLVTKKESKQENLTSGSLVIGGIPVKLLKSLIASCGGHHPAMCQSDDMNKLSNLKVFDCKQRKVVLAPPSCQYVALSYVWGSPKKDNRSNSSTEPTSIVIPKTVEDSLRVTEALGYKYLWVDRYVRAGEKH